MARLAMRAAAGVLVLGLCVPAPTQGLRLRPRGVVRRARPRFTMSSNTVDLNGNDIGPLADLPLIPPARAPVEGTPLTDLPSFNEATSALPLAGPPEALGEQRHYIELYNRAKMLDMRGDMGGSLDILKRLCRLNPRDGRLWRRMARMARDSGSLEAAHALLEEGLRWSEENAHLWHGIGELERLLATGDGGRASLRRCIECAEVEGDVEAAAKGYHSLASQLMEAGENEEATQLIGRGLIGAPRNTRLVHKMAVLQSRMGKHQVAVQVLQNGLALTPGHAHLTHALATSKWKLGDDAAALRLFEELVENHSRYVPGWMGLVQLLELQGDVDGARAAYNDAVSRHEFESDRGRNKKKGRGSKSWARWAPLLTSRAVFEMINGGAEEGRRCFIEAVNLLREGGALDARLVTTWANAEFQLGNRQQAEKLFNRALAMEDANYVTYAEAARAASAVGDHNKARSLYLKATDGAVRSGSAVKKHMAMLLADWAGFEAERGDVARARVLIEKAVAMEGPRDQVPCWIWTAYARIEVVAEDLLRAKNYASRAVMAASRNTAKHPTLEQRAAAWEMMAQIEQRLGREKEAAELRHTAVMVLEDKRERNDLGAAVRQLRASASVTGWRTDMMLQSAQNLNFI